MKVIFALLAVAAAEGAAPHVASNDDARAVTELVLANEARIHSDPEYFGPGCVRMETTAVAFDEDRQRLANLARNIAEATGQQQADLRRIRERWSQVHVYDWARPRASPGASTDQNRLDAAEAHALSEAAHRIIHAGPQARLLEHVDPTWIKPPLQACRNDRSLPSLSVSSPAFHEEIAFVETGFVCGGLCGFGQLYALRRRDGAWGIVAVTNTWVS